MISKYSIRKAPTKRTTKSKAALAAADEENALPKPKSRKRKVKETIAAEEIVDAMTNALSNKEVDELLTLRTAAPVDDIALDEDYD